MPELQSRLESGCVKKLPLFAEPHVPFTLSVAEQLELVPPFIPWQVQPHGPDPVSEEAVPDLQRLDVGAEK